MTGDEKIKIKFLGTGSSQGVPVISCACKVCRSEQIEDKRLRSSILISIRKKALLIDAGPDFRQQILRADVTKLDAVILTHEHTDHIFGLDDIRAFNWTQKKPMDIYAEARVNKYIKQIYPYVFAKFQIKGIPEFNLHEISEGDLLIEEIAIQAIRGLHYKLPVLGFRIENFAYITDMNFLEEKEKQKLKNLNTLVVGAVHKEKHTSHFNLEEARCFIEELKPEQAYITHISHNMGLYQEIKKELPNNVFLAYDGLELTLF